MEKKTRGYGHQKELCIQCIGDISSILRSRYSGGATHEDIIKPQINGRIIVRKANRDDDWIYLVQMMIVFNKSFGISFVQVTWVSTYHQ